MLPVKNNIELDEDFIITVNEARQCFSGCIPGWKYFASKHNYNWKDVVKNGLPASELLSTGDLMAIQLVEWAYERRRKTT